MNTKLSSWLIILFALFLSFFVIDDAAVYAQEDAVVVTQVFKVRPPGDALKAANANSSTCEVTAELRWYKKKQVRVLYHWQACAGTNTLRWELASVQNVSGDFVFSDSAGQKEVYKATWPELAEGDTLTLHTWINDVKQADVVTVYREVAPIWVKLHTRTDAAGACFQFTGHVDPWGVFTAGDHTYTFELNTDEWATPWIAGPNQATVDWHVQFYRDPQLTQLRTEYWFNNVANPCYTLPPTCDGIALSIPNGAAIPATGADVTVTINGQHGSQYQLVDQNGTVVAGPSVDPLLSFHALPGITYQAQVYSDGFGWTKSGCQFQYAMPVPPTCDSIELSLPNGSFIPESGAAVQVTITGQHGTQYRIVDASDAVVAGPSASATLSLHALPNITYQAQVYSDGFGWTTAGCQFAYQVTLPPTCEGVALSLATDLPIPDSGADVQVTINGQHGTQYRVVDEQGNIVAAASSSNVLSLHVIPGTTYQAQVYNESYGWTTSGCQFRYDIIVLPAFCNGVTLSIRDNESIPAEGADIEVTIHASGAKAYRIVDEENNVVAGPSANPVFTLHVKPNTRYIAQIFTESEGWSTDDSCRFQYMTPPPPPVCNSVDLSIANEAVIPETGADVQVTINGQAATEYRIVDQHGNVLAGPSANPAFSFHAIPNLAYQGQVRNAIADWTKSNCDFVYKVEQRVRCNDVVLSIPNGATLPESGAAVAVTVAAENAKYYRLVDGNGVVAGPSENALLHLHALPLIGYQAQVSNDNAQWTDSGCEFQYNIEVTPVCDGVTLSVPQETKIAATGADVQVTIHGQNATQYRIVDRNGKVMAGPGAENTFQLHAMPDMSYQAQVANAKHGWTDRGCDFQYETEGAAQIACELDPDHYGDPGGISRITAWIEGKSEPVAIEKVVINWDHAGTVTYPTKRQMGPWFTNVQFEIKSRPEVHDVGFGAYKFEAWVYVTGFTTPAYCWGVGHAPDHDNVLPDPGPFAKANAEGKFNRGNAPSRLPTVGRLPFDGGNGPEKVELILWAFEKEGRGVDARITTLANDGKPLVRLGMESVSNVVKFDGLPAREGIVYGFQIGEHGPWSPLFCPKADSNPTTITVYWAAGGMTWLSDGAAYGDCWWLTVAAALKGWVTVDESVATYNALQPVIDWNGHRNLVFSLAQSKETGLGPRMQDAVIGLQARQWQDAVIPEQRPADFQATVDAYRNAQ